MVATMRGGRGRGAGGDVVELAVRRVSVGTWPVFEEAGFRCLRPKGAKPWVMSFTVASR